MSDFAQIIRVTQDLDRPVPRTAISGVFAEGDALAHTVRMTLLSDGAPADLTDAEVLATFLREGRDEEIRIDNGTADGNIVTVTTTQDCYAEEGAFVIAIKIKKGDVKRTIFYGYGDVTHTQAGTIISGDYIIMDIDVLIAKIDELDTATAAAEAATQEATTAAGTANAAAQEATGAAGQATSAAETANEAAMKINGMDVTVTMLAPDAQPSAALETGEDGAFDLHLGLPRGETGDTGTTPNIDFEVATGEPGTQVSIEMLEGSTPENPKYLITIPRGADGAGGGTSGQDGGYYTPTVTQSEAGQMQVSFSASKEGMPEVASVTVNLPRGEDGTDGQDGTNGQDGGYYTPTVTQSEAGQMQVSFSASKESMPEVASVTVNLPQGEPGSFGAVFYDTVVPAASFVSDATSADYPFRAAVALEGVTASMIPMVMFGFADASGGTFSDVAQTHGGGIYIYASEAPSADITIPTILCLGEASE